MLKAEKSQFRKTAIALAALAGLALAAAPAFAEQAKKAPAANSTQYKTEAEAKGHCAAGDIVVWENPRRRCITTPATPITAKPRGAATRAKRTPALPDTMPRRRRSVLSRGAVRWAGPRAPLLSNCTFPIFRTRRRSTHRRVAPTAAESFYNSLTRVLRNARRAVNTFCHLFL